MSSAWEGNLSMEFADMIQERKGRGFQSIPAIRECHTKMWVLPELVVDRLPRLLRLLISFGRRM